MKVLLLLCTFKEGVTAHKGRLCLNSRDELLHLLTRTTPVSVYNLLKDYGINSLDYWMRNKADQKGLMILEKKVRKLD